MRCVIMPYRVDLINPCAQAKGGFSSGVGGGRSGREGGRGAAGDVLVAEGARGKPSAPESIRGEPPHQYSRPRRVICSRSLTPSLLLEEKPGEGGGRGRRGGVGNTAENRRPAPTGRHVPRLMVIKREARGAAYYRVKRLSAVRGGIIR